MSDGVIRGVRKAAEPSTREISADASVRHHFASAHRGARSRGSMCRRSRDQTRRVSRSTRRRRAADAVQRLAARRAPRRRVTSWGDGSRAPRKKFSRARAAAPQRLARFTAAMSLPTLGAPRPAAARAAAAARASPRATCALGVEVVAGRAREGIGPSACARRLGGPRRAAGRGRAWPRATRVVDEQVGGPRVLLRPRRHGSRAEARARGGARFRRGGRRRVRRSAPTRHSPPPSPTLCAARTPTRGRESARSAESSRTTPPPLSSASPSRR